MRIISGKRRGYKLAAPEGLDTRPTTDRVKESVFNIIQTRLPCGFVLDMFAGSGGMGIEALSRGAKGAVFTESNPAALKVLKKNLSGSGLGGDAAVLQGDAFDLLRRLSMGAVTARTDGGAFDRKAGFDIVFLDPPYNKGLVNKALELICELRLIRPGGIVVTETEVGGEEIADFGLAALKKAKYGKTVITVMQR